MTRKSRKFSNEESEELTASDFQEIFRFHAMRFLKEGLNNSQVARQFGVSRQAVSKWKKAFDKYGERGIAKKTREARSAVILFFWDTLKQKLEAGAKAAGWPDDRWTGIRVRLLFERMMWMRVSRPTIKRCMNRMGWYFDHDDRRWRK